MEETTQGLDETNNTANGKVDGMTETEFEKAKTDGIAYETHQRALKQKVALREKAEALESQLQAYKQRDLESQGKHAEVIEAQRKQIAALEEKSRTQTANYQWNVVGAQIKSKLATKGVNNPDGVFKYAVAAHKEDLKAVEVDDQYNVNEDDLNRFIDKFLTDNSSMGFVNKVKVDDIVPGHKAAGVTKEKGISKLSDDDLMEAWIDAD